jgi:RNA polymerase sigma-70 factor (ECF subfamily)
MFVMADQFDTSPTVQTCCCSDWMARLAKGHATRLAAIARHEGLGPADALDVVQDAFGTLLARPDAAQLKQRPDEDGARVLSVIVRNAARNLRRRHHHARPHVELDEARLVTDARPDDVLENRRQNIQLAGCMTELGDVHRHVITLRVLEELSGDEAAAALGLTPGHVAVLLHRARKQLADCMDR